MPSTNMNTFTRRGSMDNKFTTPKYITQQLPVRKNNFRHPTRIPRISKIANSSNESLIDGALAIINSPQPSSKPRVTRRRGSLLTGKQANELLLDSSGRLSEMMQKRNSRITFNDH